MFRRAALWGGLVLLLPLTAAAREESSAIALLRAVDERQQNSGDWRSVVYLQEKEKNRDDLVYDAVTMRRSSGRQFVMLFTQPKSSAGQGYLRVDRNLWFYDPSVGKWERRTERERIGGTGGRRSDFDEWHLSDEYNPRDAGEETLGKRVTEHLILQGKPGLDLAFPLVHLWIDKESKTVLKRQDFALSGRLLRTTYYPKWAKIYSPSKKGEVWYPQEVRFYDELESGKSTLLLIKEVDPRPLESNLFTKAWLERQSR